MVVGTILLGSLKISAIKASRRHIMEAMKQHQRMPRDIPMRDDAMDDLFSK